MQFVQLIMLHDICPGLGARMFKLNALSKRGLRCLLGKPLCEIALGVF